MKTLMLAAAVAFVVASAFADDSYLTPDMAPIAQHYEEQRMDTGRLMSASLRGGASSVMYSQTLKFEGATWVRLVLNREETELTGTKADSAYLRITSLKDGYTQYLDAVSIRQWQFTSGYFNGDSVRVDVVGRPQAAPARVAVLGAWVGESRSNATVTSICEQQDPRQLSEDPRAGRWMGGGGCSGWLINDANNCFLTAGHCGTDFGGGGVLEFNVPLSTATGAIVHPPLEDQFPADPDSLQRVNGGVGNDWQYMGTFPNSNTGRTAFEHQGAAYILASQASPVDGQGIYIAGYGTTESDLPREWSQVQKDHTGPYTSYSGSTIRYTTSTTGGNSGSGVEDVDTGLAIGIHTHGGCSRAGTGSNAGTAIDNPGLQEALANPRGICAA